MSGSDVDVGWADFSRPVSISSHIPCVADGSTGTISHAKRSRLLTVIHRRRPPSRCRPPYPAWCRASWPSAAWRPSEAPLPPPNASGRHQPLVLVMRGRTEPRSTVCGGMPALCVAGWASRESGSVEVKENEVSMRNAETTGRTGSTGSPSIVGSARRRSGQHPSR